MTAQIVLALIWAVVAVVGSVFAIALFIGAVRDVRAVQRLRAGDPRLLLLARGSVKKYAAVATALLMFVMVGVASVMLPAGTLRMYLGRSLIVAEALLVVMLEIDWRIQRVLVRPAIVEARAEEAGPLDCGAKED